MAGGLTISTLNDSSGVLATQNGMSGICKSWVRFVGSTATITGSFNVSSVTRNSTGLYTVNFTTSMPDANYSVSLSGDLKTGVYRAMGQTINAGFATGSIQVNFNNDGNGANIDPDRSCVQVFR